MKNVFTIQSTTAQWLKTTPMTIALPPGPGKYILSANILLVHQVNTIPLGDGTIAFNVCYTGPSYSPTLATITPSFYDVSTYHHFGFNSASSGTIESLATSENLGLVLSTSEDFENWGRATGAFVQTPGSGYAIGDTGLIIGPTWPTGIQTAIYEVTHVDGSGGVLDDIDVLITPNGSGIRKGPHGVGGTNTPTTVSTGSGDGNLTFDVAGIEYSDSSLLVVVEYDIVDLVSI